MLHSSSTYARGSSRNGRAGRDAARTGELHTGGAYPPSDAGSAAGRRRPCPEGGTAAHLRLTRGLAGGRRTALRLDEGSNGRPQLRVGADDRGRPDGAMADQPVTDLGRVGGQRLRNPPVTAVVEPASTGVERGGKEPSTARFRPGCAGCGICSMELLKSGQQGSAPCGACRGEDTGCTAPSRPQLKAATTPMWTTYGSAPSAPLDRGGALRPRNWSGPTSRK